MQKLINVQDAIVRRLYDDELNVVQAALSIDGLSILIDHPCLFKAYQDVLSRCVRIIEKCENFLLGFLYFIFIVP